MSQVHIKKIKPLKATNSDGKIVGPGTTEPGCFPTR